MTAPTRAAHDRPMRIESLGAGRQSTALFILGCKGELVPKLDAAVFADTGWEPKRVMRHLADLQRFGEEHGVPVYLASKGCLPDDVLNPHVFATIPAWTKSRTWQYVPTAFGFCPQCTVRDGDALTVKGLFGDERCEDCDGVGLVPVSWEKRLISQPKGKILRQCTPKYKIEPILAQVRLLLGAEETFIPCRYCNETGERIAPWDPEAGMAQCSICRGSGRQRRVGSPAQGASAEQWIGFSLDEWERATTAGFPSYQTPKFPLLELGWTVEMCEELNRAHMLDAQRSACLGCPLHDDEYWIGMKYSSPGEFAETVAYDAKIRTGSGLTGERYLHESLVPLAEAVELAERRLARRGTQMSLWGTPAARAKSRGCSPYGCRSTGQDGAPLIGAVEPGSLDLSSLSSSVAEWIAGKMAEQAGLAA